MLRPEAIITISKQKEVILIIEKQFIFRWENRYSNETGLVRKIDKAKGHFENTLEIKKAKAYKTMRMAEKGIETLMSLDDAKDNIYSVVGIEAEE